MIIGKKYFIVLWVLHAPSVITPKTPHLFSCYLIIHYPAINNHSHVLR